MMFTARQQGAVLAVVKWKSTCPSALSVCHTLVLYQNDSNYDHALFTGEEPHDSNFFMVNFTGNFESKWNIRRGANGDHEGRIGKFANFQPVSCFLVNFLCQCLTNNNNIRNGARQDQGYYIVWQTNRKSHMNFRLMPKSSSLDDLEWPIRTRLHKRIKDASFGAQYKKFHEDRPIYYQQ